MSLQVAQPDEIETDYHPGISYFEDDPKPR